MGCADAACTTNAGGQNDLEEPFSTKALNLRVLIFSRWFFSIDMFWPLVLAYGKSKVAWPASLFLWEHDKASRMGCSDAACTTNAGHLNNLELFSNRGCECVSFDFSRVGFSASRFTCEGFLLLWKGCMLVQYDFAFVSGLVFLQKTLWILWVLWSAGFRTCLPLVSQLPPTTLWILWVLLSAWIRTCVSLVSHFSRGGLPPTTLWIPCPHELSTRWDATCLPVPPLHSGFFARSISGLSPTCVPTCLPLLSTLHLPPFSQRHGSFCIVCGTTTTANHLQPTTTFNLCLVRPHIPWN